MGSTSKMSKLLEMIAFDVDLWQWVLKTAIDKDIDKALINEYATPTKRDMLVAMIEEGKKDFGIPHIGRIPKDEPGEFRDVRIETEDGRIVFSFINAALFRLFPNMVHKSCMAYRKGISTSIPVKQCSEYICNSGYKKVIGIKVDYHHFFDTVYKHKLWELLDKMEAQLGFEKGTEPVINLIRRTYDSDLYIGLDKKPHKEWAGIRQGNPLASFFADAILYDVDKYMSENYKFYCRYSDDSVILTDDPDKAIADIKRLTEPYGLSLNDKKTEILYRDQYFKFLGYSIRGENITISKGRLQKFEREIRKRTIGNYLIGYYVVNNKTGVKTPLKYLHSDVWNHYNKDEYHLEYNGNVAYSKALRSVMSYLYGDKRSQIDYSWASSILPTINVEEDLQEMNKFVMDCLRAMKTNKRRINGIGYEPNKGRKDPKTGKHYVRKGVVTYSPTSGGAGGQNVKANRDKLSHLEGYLTLIDAKRTMCISKGIFSMKRRMAS